MSKYTAPSGMTRRDFLRVSGTLGALAAVTAALPGCGTGPASSGSVGSGDANGLITAVIGYGNDQSWDPTMTASAFSMAAINHIYEGLLENDPVTREPYAGLATEVLDDPTATSWRFTLREGATWHDGQPVTVDDVVFTFQRILDPQANTLLRSFFGSWLKEAKKVDETTGELVFNYPFPAAAERLAIAKIMPRHVFDGKWEEAKAGLAVGSGPFKLKKHTPKSNTTFEAFDDYNGPRPATVKEMNWFSIVDAAARVAKISGGSAEAQISDNIPAGNVEQLESSGLTVSGGRGMNHMFLMFNTQSAPFDDVRVRQALHYAIDTPTMIEVALKGYGSPSTSFLNEDNPSYAEASTVYSYDPDKARTLLAKAGVSGLTVNLMAANVSWLADCLPTIAASWEAVGVTTTLEPQDTSALFTKMDQAQDYQVVAAASNPNQFGIDADLILRYNYIAGGLWMKYSQWETSPEATALFALMDQATEEPDEQAKLDLTHQVLDVIAENAVIYPVVHTELLTAWNPDKLSGVEALPYPGVNLLEAKLA